MTLWRFTPVALVGLAAFVGLRAQAPPGNPPQTIPKLSSTRIASDVITISCEPPGFSLEKLDAANPAADAEVWERVIGKLRSGSMPSCEDASAESGCVPRGIHVAAKASWIRRGRRIRIRGGLGRCIG